MYVYTIFRICCDNGAFAIRIWHANEMYASSESGVQRRMIKQYKRFNENCHLI